MTPTALGLVVVAAVLHVGWNAMTIRAGDKFLFLWSAMTVASLFMAVPAVVIVARTGIDGPGAIYVGISAALHAVYFWTLTQAYRIGDLSRVYPIARGLSVALVAIAAWPLLSEVPTTTGAIGLAVVVCGVAAVAIGPRPDGVGWAVFTGVIIASYSLIDRRGVDYMEPLPYVSLLGGGACALLLPVVWNRRDALRAEWRAGARSIVVAALFSLSGYVLVLHAMRLSNTSYVVASRELSIVMSVAVGRLFLGERPTPARFAGAAIIVAGVFCLAVAR